MRMVLYDYIPNKDSKKDIVQAMKENLELANHKTIKEFSFSINNPYEKEVIGYGPYKTSYTYDLLPDFTGDSKAQAQATANRLGISVNFTGGDGYVIAQEYPASKRLDKIRGSVTLTLGGSKKEEELGDEDEKDKDKDKVTEEDPEEGNDETDEPSTGDETPSTGAEESKPDVSPTPTPPSDTTDSVQPDE